MLVISTDSDHVGAPASRRALSPMLCLLPLIATVISDLYSETRGALLESNATTILVNRGLLASGQKGWAEVFNSIQTPSSL
jgi:hypothetical protein